MRNRQKTQPASPAVFFGEKDLYDTIAPMDIFAKLFGGAARVKIMRLFLRNPESVLTPDEVQEKSRVTADACRKELSLLTSIGLLTATSLPDFSSVKPGKKGGVKKIKAFRLNQDFPHVEPLRNLIVTAASFNREALIDRCKRAGKVTLLVTAGMFVQSPQGRLDLLIVGDDFKPALLEGALKTLESEAGCEVRYAVFTSNDFLYRLGIYDKFIRDILDYPHERLIDKLHV